jgi:hypothetical protein
LPEVIRYAQAHGIGIILYLNHVALERQLDALLPLYEKWGVKDIKLGFVNVGAQPNIETKLPDRPSAQPPTRCQKKNRTGTNCATAEHNLTK